MVMLYVKLREIGQKLQGWDRSPRLLWGVVCIGILLHSAQYVFNRSLWVDEAGVALNILDKSYTQLLPNLSSQAEIDYTETAPTGFLLIEKFLVHLYGDSEYVLRLWPFVCGILSLVLFFKLLPFFASPSAQPIALLLCITSSQLIYYSSALKQYSGDVFFALLLYVLAITIYSHPPTWRMMFVFGIVGAIAIWCSHPVVFVLAGIGGWIGIVWLKKKQFGNLSKLLVAYGWWGVSFVLRYALLLRQIVGHDVLEQFWGDRFMPFPPTSVADLLWFPHMLFDTIGYVMGLPMFQSFFQMFSQIGQILGSFLGLSLSSGLSLPETVRLLFSNMLWIGVYVSATALLIIGGVTMMRKRTDRLLLLFAPVVLNLIASGLHRYPFGNRMILFIIFSFFLVIGEGAAWIISTPPKKIPLSGILAIGLVCLFPLYHAAAGLASPRKHEEARPVMAYLKDHKRPTDVIYVYYASQQVFTYYARRFDLPSEAVIHGIASRDDWLKYVDDLNQLRGQPRVWLFFSHAYAEEAFFLSYLDTIGKRQDAFQDVRAAVYLYDLR